MFPLVKDPLPLCVQEMVPLEAEAPLTVAVLLTQITEVPPALASGSCCTVISDWAVFAQPISSVAVNEYVPELPALALEIVALEFELEKLFGPLQLNDRLFPDPPPVNWIFPPWQIIPLGAVLAETVFRVKLPGVKLTQIELLKSVTRLLKSVLEGVHTFPVPLEYCASVGDNDSKSTE